MEFSTTGPRLDRFLKRHVLDYCDALGRKSELLFVISLASLSLVLSAMADMALSGLGLSQSDRPELLKFGIGGLFVMGVILAPLLETLLLQQIPIVLTRRFGMSTSVQLLMGTVPFAASHLGSGASTAVAAGVMGGVVYSVAYLTFIDRSKVQAFFITAAVHSLHNLVACVLIARELT